MKVAVIRFPGSNCDLDMVAALKLIKNVEPVLVWHEDPGLASSGYGAVVLPGGFSFADRLRAGVIAANSPAMASVKRLAERGTPVLGVCNGFQTLVESGLLPGALLRNTTLKFVCKWVNVRVENTRTPFTSGLEKGQVLAMPVAHGEGRFYLPHQELAKLESDGLVAFRYCEQSGKVTAESNPTGTLHNIAGVCNKEGNVVGLMPHPERAAEAILSPLGRSDGATMLSSLSVRTRGRSSA
ncbi:MAG TPA: phosphoribosylformylglycinamidine synthase I [Nitrososphaerales archaeon]|nr:phosphoribosylformylglycinamidine synthase I [Nitrososphaerales archaeon]HUK74206.1 phosphoribosylformylglycinamidine synthase I [Nitrososphaerales archaeon]